MKAGTVCLVGVTCLTIFHFMKGNRFAMPLSRIALQSPAGAARGQVRSYLFLSVEECFNYLYLLPVIYREPFFGRPMTFVMKQMSFSG